MNIHVYMLSAGAAAIAIWVALIAWDGRSMDQQREVFRQRKAHDTHARAIRHGMRLTQWLSRRRRNTYEGNGDGPE